MCLTLVCWATISALAQPAPSPTPHPIPVGNLIERRSPPFSKWTITCMRSSTAAAIGLEEKKSTPQAQKVVRRITFTRNKNILNEQIINDKGERFETWRIGNLQFTTFPGSTERVEIDPKDETDGQSYSDLSKTDFPDFAWVTDQTYVDVQEVRGRECIIFKTGDSADSVVGCVDLRTRLPFLLQTRKETRLYEFDTSSQPTLTIPQDLQELLERRAKQLEQMARMPARPW